MTAVLNVTCDKCGVTIVADRAVLDVRSGPMRVRRETIDLCTACSSLLLIWLAARPEAPSTSR